MSLPYFFAEYISESETALEEETSKHIVQVLRMKPGEHLRLTDGKGNAAEGEITDAHKKHCIVKIINKEFIPKPSRQLTIAISLIKNMSRFEWFIEKATELGVAEIIPMICERTEKQKFRHGRFLNICTSAMLQSMQTWRPQLHEPVNFKDVVNDSKHQQKIIAHCLDDDKRMLNKVFDASLSSHIILIGPEGDFSVNEINLAREHGFIPVSLGGTRLRTETAGIYASVVMMNT